MGGWEKGGEEEVVGNGTGFPGQLRRTDGQSAACQHVRTEMGTVPRLAAAMNPPYSTPIRVRDVERKKRGLYTNLTCILRL